MKKADLSKQGKSKKKSFCKMPKVPERVFSPGMDPRRMRLINTYADKWVSGTKLKYYFFKEKSDGEKVEYSDGSKKWHSWGGEEVQKQVVRKAFDLWKKVGIGIEFEEVKTPQEAEIRIGFMEGDGAWSYLGRQILEIPKDERTMNFGWDLTSGPEGIDTAVHEIGHTLGFPHEHQNPNAGIVWNEKAVYASLGGPPNNWSREDTYHNIIRKIPANTVQGTKWDHNSIMHYPFEAGLIKEPARFKNGLFPKGGLSTKDIEWVRILYPKLGEKRPEELIPLDLKKLSLNEGEQVNFEINPSETMEYHIQTFGSSDVVIVLFEKNKDGSLSYLKGNDDSGKESNAEIKLRLKRGRKYILKLRLYYKQRSGETALLMH